MKLQKISFADTNTFAPQFLDYIQQKPQLKQFYDRFPEPHAFQDQLAEKSIGFPKKNREVLYQALTDQYQSLKISDAVQDNLASLTRENTFTLTTGHQLNLFTGPLYFIYKIVTVINACKKLKSIYPHYNFVPVYWMAAEDHDFDEIRSFRLYGKKYVWESKQQGGVGRFNPKELGALLKEVPGDISIFRDAYLKHTTLSDAVRYYVNALFGSEGLIVVDGDSSSLKALFKNVIHDDLVHHTAKKLVDTTDQELQVLGYKPQVYARDINFFYLENGLRARVERKGDRFEIIDTKLSFSLHEIKELIEKSPEKLSPNVILRPLYQEVILPNLAYIGGPAEVVYWMQLKNVFQHYNVPFPMLMPRNFAMVMDAPTSRKFEKTGLQLLDLFQEKNSLLNYYAVTFAKHKVKLNGEREVIESNFKTIRKQAEAFDKTLGPLVAAEEQRAIKSLEKIEQKLLRAEKRFQADKLRQVESVKDTLFPGGGLQERTDNFLNFYQTDQLFIQKLLNHFDPFDFRFNVLMYHD